MSAIFNIAFKDLRELWRDKFGLFWVLVFPLLIATFFGVVYSGMGDTRSHSLHIAVVDDDHSDFSQTFIDTLKKRDALDVIICSMDTAENKVRRGKLSGYIHLTKGFGETMGMFGDKKNLEIGIDPGKKAESGFLQGMIMQTLFEAMQSKFSDKTHMKDMLQKGRDALKKDNKIDLTQKSVIDKFYNDLDQFMAKSNDSTYQSGFFGGKGMKMEIETKSVQRDYSGQPRSSFDITFPSAIQWGMIGCAAAFAVAMVMERRKGTYHRLRMSPIFASQILLGKGMACLLACFGDILLLIAIGVLFFHVHIGSPGFLILAGFCSAICFTGAMMFVSVLGKTEQAVGGAGWALFIIWNMFGGGMMPLMFMPGWMQRASDFSPVKWSVYALEGSIWRDFTFREMLTPCIILLGIGIFLFSIGWYVFRKQDS